MTSFLPGKDLGYSLKFESFQFCLLYGGHPIQEAAVWTIVYEVDISGNMRSNIPNEIF